MHKCNISNNSLRYLSDNSVTRTHRLITFSFIIFVATSYIALIIGYCDQYNNILKISNPFILYSSYFYYFENNWSGCYIVQSVRFRDMYIYPLWMIFKLDWHESTISATIIYICCNIISLYLEVESYWYLDRVSFSLIWVTNLIIIICMVNIELKRSNISLDNKYVFASRLYISDVNRNATSEYNCYIWILYLFIIQISLLVLFSTDNIIIFFIAFETTLLPFYLWIATGGVRDRRWHAGYYLIFYTLIGSIGMLWSICNISIITGSTKISYLYNIDSIAYDTNDSTRLWYSFIFLSVAFLIKFPVFPFASWLPEAHVEASAEASTLLASVLLKVAPYGFYRIIMHLFPIWLDWSQDLFVYIGLASGLIYVISLTVQTDLKRIIAYTSIIHMSIILCLLVASSTESIYSALLMAILHSFCSAGLFLLLGFLYDFDKTKNMNYLNGMAEVRPIYSLFFFLFNLINIGYPLIGSFVSEFIAVLVPISSTNYIWVVLLFIIMFILTASIFFMLCKILFMTVNSKITRKFVDINKDQISCILILFFGCVILGLNPKFYTDFISWDIERLYIHIHGYKL